MSIIGITEMSSRELSVNRRFGTDRQKRGCLPREGFVVLKQGPVPGVRVRQEHRVWQVLDQAVRVGDRDHLVVNAVHDERRMADGSKFREALTREALPLT